MFKFELLFFLNKSTSFVRLIHRKDLKMIKQICLVLSMICTSIVIYALLSVYLLIPNNKITAIWQPYPEFTIVSLCMLIPGFVFMLSSVSDAYKDSKYMALDLKIGTLIMSCLAFFITIAWNLIGLRGNTVQQIFPAWIWPVICLSVAASTFVLPFLIKFYWNIARYKN